MSLAELLPALRLLPSEDKVRLMHLLVDEVSGCRADETDLPESVRQLIPPPGAVIGTGYRVTTDAEGWQVLLDTLVRATSNP